MNIHKTQYASNAKGNAGVALGSVALGLAGANAIAPGGIVERVLGGKKCSCEGGDAAMATLAAALAANGASASVIAEKDAHIAKLEAERYSDNKVDALKENLLRDWLKPLSDRAAEQMVKEAKMEAEISGLKETAALRETILRKDIELAEQRAQCCCKQNSNDIAVLAAIVGKVTNTIIPMSAVCPAPMPQFNSWTAPTATTTQAAAA